MKKKYLIFSTIVFIVFTMHCNTSFNKNNADYEVASAFFNIILKECKKVPIDTLYVFDSSIVFSNKNEYLKNIDLTKKNIPKELIDNFFNINSTGIQFKNKFNFELPYKILNENQVQTYLNSKYGSEIYKRWLSAGGVKYFSRVGFSNDKTEALICYKGYGGPLAASCYLIHMKKDRKCWKIVNEIQLWIS